MSDALRKLYLSENWKIDIDPEDTGLSLNWINNVSPRAQSTDMPATIQETFPTYRGLAWYWCSFDCPLRPEKGERLMLRFGAVDYKAYVYLNGVFVGEDENGESAFSFDVTDVIKPGGKNLLAVRVIAVSGRDYDGLNICNTPNRNKALDVRSGCTPPFGGFLQGVELYLQEKVAVTDIFATGDIHTGTVTVRTYIMNNSDKTEAVSLKTAVVDRGGIGEEIVRREESITVPPGKSEHIFEISVPQHRLWDVDDPYLYRIHQTLVSDYSPSFRSVRFGFRELHVSPDGYFTLNGRRIFLKCSHTGNMMPIGIIIPKIRSMTRIDFTYAKAAGLNTIRACAMMFRPEQLDYCDEIGLMIMDEHYASWQLGWGDLPLGDLKTCYDRYDSHAERMVLQDRKHPCVTMYQMLNETDEDPVFRRAVDYLPRLRQLDPSRLVLLSSGRFDHRHDIGTVSNPYTDTWEPLWGFDKNIQKPEDIDYTYTHVFPGLSFGGAGDVHFYPQVPQGKLAFDCFANMGKNTHPIFLSEYGVGAMYHVIHEWRSFQQVQAREDLLDLEFVRSQSIKFIKDFHDLGLDDIFPFPEALLNESQRLSSHQRRLGFDLIRSNPQINGFSITGLLDHGYCGEGLWTYFRRWKPEMFDIISDGFSPLRWCILTMPNRVCRAGEPIDLRISLATEDALVPGSYPVTVRIFGKDGPVWEKKTAAVIGEYKPLAVDVIHETISLDVPSGAYQIVCNLDEGGSPTGETRTLHILNDNDLPACPASVTGWGLAPAVETLLKKRGTVCSPFTGSETGLILVGSPRDLTDGKWQELRACAEKGATVLFLDATLFADQGQRLLDEWFGGQVKAGRNFDWLYHKEIINMRHPMFDGLPIGMVDMNYYGDVFAPENFTVTGEGYENIACSFVSGYFAVEGGYAGYRQVFRRAVGQGAVIVNAYALSDHAGDNPAADRMILNLIRTYG